MIAFSRKVLGWFGFAVICGLGNSIGYAGSSDDLTADEPPIVSAGEASEIQPEDGPAVSQPAVSQPAVVRPAVIRLPRYFSGIVDQRQRMAIQEIQVRYRIRLEDLEKELAELREQQMREMEQVLTQAQLKLLNQKREQARSARRAMQSDSEATEESDTAGESDSP